jgi:ATP-dependent DNA ligase
LTHAGKEGPAASCALLLPPPAHWAACLIDGEAVACDDDGMPVFDRLRYRRDRVFLYAFDLIELSGADLRREPIERRKVLLIQLLAKASVGLQVNETLFQCSGGLG